MRTTVRLDEDLLKDAKQLAAYRADAPQHRAYREWLEGAVNGDEAYGLSVVTHFRVFASPSPIAHAVQFANVLRDRPDCVRVAPGPRHWSIFIRLCREAGVRGNLVPDAYLAALAIESGSEWVTTDRDYSGFPGLRWRHPLAAD